MLKFAQTACFSSTLLPMGLTDRDKERALLMLSSKPQTATPATNRGIGKVASPKSSTELDSDHLALQ